jgi:hypothetical protein
MVADDPIKISVRLDYMAGGGMQLTVNGDVLGTYDAILELEPPPSCRVIRCEGPDEAAMTAKLIEVLEFVHDLEQ